MNINNRIKNEISIGAMGSPMYRIKNMCEEKMTELETLRVDIERNNKHLTSDQEERCNILLGMEMGIFEAMKIMQKVTGVTMFEDIINE